jgi:hypothetical protein
LRPVYQELVRQEKLTGVYRCQIVGRIVTEYLICQYAKARIACPAEFALR